MGAALRHAAHVLGTERAAHRLLLVLSDGKPNDVDEYEGRYGVEDSRRAVLEARADGMTVFCMTVDREAPRYLPRVFGPTGYVMLRHAAGLPAATLHLLRRLVVH
jgi:nitric oxide reductase NorD protein